MVPPLKRHREASARRAALEPQPETELEVTRIPLVAPRQAPPANESKRVRARLAAGGGPPRQVGVGRGDKGGQAGSPAPRIPNSGGTNRQSAPRSRPAPVQSPRPRSATVRLRYRRASPPWSVISMRSGSDPRAARDRELEHARVRRLAAGDHHRRDARHQRVSDLMRRRTTLVGAGGRGDDHRIGRHEEHRRIMVQNRDSARRSQRCRARTCRAPAAGSPPGNPFAGHIEEIAGVNHDPLLAHQELHPLSLPRAVRFFGTSQDRVPPRRRRAAAAPRPGAPPPRERVELSAEVLRDARAVAARSARAPRGSPGRARCTGPATKSRCRRSARGAPAPRGERGRPGDAIHPA